ncbi:hypothetical protein ES332_D04G119700v1 [Gossypium tomentosum]|uniref:Uncharacterized protein n=1 Tax=Gossypium tomentosum TaxID=34277 RepID=A0A5D2LFL1_GOSTO|nr:hypothetical protein ES332_D04G119700v1 [Gossypium tomentosum]
MDAFAIYLLPYHRSWPYLYSCYNISIRWVHYTAREITGQPCYV